MAVIAASILDADFANLKHEMQRVADAGVDAFSLDVMDGHFVPRATFGEFLVGQIRAWVDVPLEVHLMVEEPFGWVDRMADAGADLVMFHLEATAEPLRVVERIRARGRLPGLAVRNDTPVDDLPADVLDAVEVVNLVAVPLGWGGSASAEDTFDRIVRLRGRLDALGGRVAIEVDGGVKPDNATKYVEAGADMLTSGTGIYHSPDARQAVRRLLESTRDERDEVARRRLERFLALPSRSHVHGATRG
jgi:ribulose-phosphate 3-epimerase